MIIYEVNLKISLSIFEAYMDWLTPHVYEMLTFPGFQFARMLSEISEDLQWKLITMQYEVESREQLEIYFQQHAPQMREEGIQRFPHQFSATRRIFEVQNIFYSEHPNDTIELLNYDPAWPDQALTEMCIIQKKCHFDFVFELQHIGSTAIPGFPAKPIIDLMIGVPDLSQARAFIPVLTSLGYLFWKENPKKDRLFFVKGMPPYGKQRTHHVHIFENHAPEWKARLAFRDYLRSHEEEKIAYLQLKQQLSHQFKQNREAYTEGKSTFICTVVEKALRESHEY